MRILGIAGSVRRGSHNRRLLRAAGAMLPPGVDFVEWEGLAGLPLLLVFGTLSFWLRVTSPSIGGSCAASSRASVVLPLPFRPRSAIRSLGSSRRLSRLSTGVSA